MHGKRPFRIMPAGALLLLMACAAPSNADAFHVFKVDPFCPDPSVYSTIQAAVDAAAAYSDADHADYVWISDNTDINGYENQHIVVNDSENVIIEGGFFDCTDFDPGNDFTLVSGGNADGGPVFEIVGNGNNVYFGNLLITGATRAGDASGGGISFSGHGEIDIAKTVIVANQAGYGAGINVAGSGGNAVLKLLDSVQINSNTATVSGGGVRVEGSARAIVTGVNTTISANSAANNGGGVEVVGPARIDIGSSGYGAGVVAGNHAANGGGIALIDVGSGEAIARIFADGSHRPSPIVNNRATSNGGAIYLEGLGRACLYAPHLVNNIAEDGAALYRNEFVSYDTGSEPSNRSSGGGFYLNEVTAELGAECGPEPVADLGGTTSCYTDDCNVLSGQQTRHADDTPSSGAMIYNVTNQFLASRLRVRGNTAGTLIRDKGGDTTVLRRCLIADNSTSGNLVDWGTGYTEAVMLLDTSTIANNTIGGADVFDFDFGHAFTVSFYGDIIAQTGKVAAAYGVAQTFEAAYIVAVDTAGLPSANPGVIQGTPIFVNPNSGDYHLRATSPGVDFAPGGEFPDLDGNAFLKDLPQVTNKFGAVDLGAYELQTAFACDASADVVFCDGFGP